MLADHLTALIRSKLKEILTPSQERLIKILSDFTLNNSDDTMLLITGYAGTGKTTMLSAYVEMLEEVKMKSVLLAPTGRAAKVLTSYSGHPAYTIHKKIYRQKSSKDGFGKFALDKNLHSRTIFIVDEASMVSNEKQEGSVFGTGKLLDDLIEYVYNGKGCKLILVGDTAQLPPVGLDISPALSVMTLENYSGSIAREQLVEVVRQKKESGILHNATEIRWRIESGNYALPLLTVEGFDDILRVSGADLIECISSTYDKTGIRESIIVSRSNKRANKYNQGIRNSILFREEELVPGELLMVVKNNYYWMMEEYGLDFIANGDIIEVVRIHKYYEMYGYRFADCTIRMIDYGVEIEAKLMLDVLYEEAPALSGAKNREMFYTILEDYDDMKPKRKQYEQVKNNAFFNAIQVKYAYAVTCHKSQGGQWNTVFIDQGYITKERIDREYLRWLYTALTRATDKVYLVNFPDFFFGNRD
jgi:exodeoxyribonuclease-5